MNEAMNRHSPDSANAILYRALDLPVGDRQQFIAQASAGDPVLLEDVRTMLSRIEQLDQFLEDPLELPVEQKTPAPLQARHGDLIGDWKVERELGRDASDLILLVRRAAASGGAFGTMRVAQAASRGGQGLARIERLRDRLAALDHPAIATPAAVATTVDGRPYFVVEHAAGEPIDQYCARHALDLGQRAALFATVCDAVHYLHQHLIVHRDLTPADLLVTPAGAVSVLDVGMAGDGWAVNPAYASPDLQAGEPLTVGADIHALGAVFYQLVTGRYAHGVDAGIMLGTSVTAALAPSAAVSAAGRPAELPEDAALAVSPALVAQLRRDVDPIVARALSLDPAVRYPSAHALARDLEGAAARLHATPAGAAHAEEAAPAAVAVTLPAPAPVIVPTLAAARRVPLALALAMLLAGLVGGVAGRPWLEQLAVEQGLPKRSGPQAPAKVTPGKQAVAAVAAVKPVAKAPAAPVMFATSLALADSRRAAGDLEGARTAAAEALALAATLALPARDGAAADANARLGAILAELGQTEQGLAALRSALALVASGARGDNGNNGNNGDAGRSALVSADLQQAIARVLAGRGDDAGAEVALGAARVLVLAQLKAAPLDAGLHARLLSIEMALATAQNAQKHGRDTVATLAGLRRLTGADGDAGVDLLEAYVQPRGTAEKAYAAAQPALATLRQRWRDGAGTGAGVDAEQARALARALTMTGEIGLRARQKGPACAHFDEAGKIYDQFEGSGRLNAYDRLAMQRLATLRQACQ